ncbi:MAG: hypothetical protein AAF658_06115 [Myxococcota bacterium]
MNSRALAVLLVLAACTEETPDVNFGQAGDGEACGQVSDCQAGLTCTSGVCAPIATATDGGFGAECTSDADCAEGLLCGRQGPDGAPREMNETGLCTDVALIGEGGACGFTVQCDFGLACSGQGLCAAEGAPGTLPEGATCAEFDDCRRPFICGPENTCVQLPLFLGLDCSASDLEAGAFRGRGGSRERVARTAMV